MSEGKRGGAPVSRRCKRGRPKAAPACQKSSLPSGTRPGRSGIFPAVAPAVGQPAGVGGPVLADNLPVLDELDVLLLLEKR